MKESIKKTFGASSEGLNPILAIEPVKKVKKMIVDFWDLFGAIKM